jgi:hypothetical protein
MYAKSIDEVLTSRLDGINEAQRRARIALVLVILSSGAILIALWNNYFSWDRKWSDVTESAPKSWGQEQLKAEQIRSWSNTNTVDISLIGIRVSINDAAELGSLVLFAFASYLCTTLLRENHEIGSLLRQQKDAPENVRQFIYYRIRALIILGGMSDNDAPMATLDSSNRRTHLPLARAGIQILLFAPFIVVLLIIISDVYYAFFFVSPGQSGSTWSSLTPEFQRQLAASDAFAVAIGILIAIYCRFSSAYVRATNDIIEEFGRTLDKSEAATD